jgi:hypothetical protein
LCSLVGAFYVEEEEVIVIIIMFLVSAVEIRPKLMKELRAD